MRSLTAVRTPRLCMSTQSLVPLICWLVLSACQQQGNETATDMPDPKATITEAVVSGLQWMNTPESAVVRDSVLEVTVGKGSDFFNNPEDGSIVATAPLLYMESAANFVAKACVQPDFSSQWNAVSLMVHLHSLHWIKLAFENSDATGPGIVTVVTRTTSDDANGAVLNKSNRIWLAVARKENLYALHWSEDGKKYHMARLSAMPVKDSVRIGIEGQSPVGEKATHSILSFEVEETTVGDLRNIN